MYAIIYYKKVYRNASDLFEIANETKRVTGTQFYKELEIECIKVDFNLTNVLVLLDGLNAVFVGSPSKDETFVEFRRANNEKN